MKYVLLFVDTPEFSAQLDAMSPEQRGRAVQKVYEWLDTHADKFRGGNKLRAPETATTVRLDRGEPVVTDGPFVEGKEMVGGYAILDVGDLDEALAVASSWPAPDVLEVRPILERG